MTPTPPHTAARLARVRSHMAGAGVDALVVTHLPNVQYLTGFVGTAGAAIVLPRRCLLVVDFRYVTAASALAAPLGGQIEVETFDHSYDEAIVDRLGRDGASRIAIEAAYLPVGRFNAISAGLAARAPLPLQSDLGTPVLVPTERLVERARVIKDPGEIAALREAGRRLASVASKGVEALVREGRTEREIARDIEEALRAAGFARPAFETIVASGPNSALPHARPTGRAVEAGDPTVLDFGGVYAGYCVDLTRTVQLGAASAALRALCAGRRRSAAGRARGGPAWDQVERHRRGGAGGSGAARVRGRLRPRHGHGLGLEVHEEPRIGKASPRLPDAVVEPGMVFTIEPGAYVPGLGGVRIEDDVLVTETGCEVLTR